MACSLSIGSRRVLFVGLHWNFHSWCGLSVHHPRGLRSLLDLGCSIIFCDVSFHLVQKLSGGLSSCGHSHGDFLSSGKSPFIAQTSIVSPVVVAMQAALRTWRHTQHIWNFVNSPFVHLVSSTLSITWQLSARCIFGIHGSVSLMDAFANCRKSIRDLTHPSGRH